MTSLLDKQGDTQIGFQSFDLFTHGSVSNVQAISRLSKARALRCHMENVKSLKMPHL